MSCLSFEPLRGLLRFKSTEKTLGRRGYSSSSDSIEKKVDYEGGPRSDIGGVVREFMPDLPSFRNIYIDLHQNPELGKHESRTANISAKHLELLGFDVHSNIGGHGVAGILRNGKGTTVLLRADMDALPVKEETGLSYASNITKPDSSGELVPVMHACGHDMHVTCLIAAATLLHKARSKWAGTLICLFQPNEEDGAGAQAMVDGGLYTKIPRPDIILGQHVDYRRSGNVAIRPGTFMATADSFVVTVFGRSGHGSQPQFSVDPIVIVAYIIVRLQSIVSRMVAPLDAAVVTCGSIHAGRGENVIPETAELKLNIRTYNSTVRTRVLEAVKSIILAECRSAGAPQDPEIKPTTTFPLTENDAHSTKMIQDVFLNFFGQDRTEVIEKLVGSEDVSNLARPFNTPYVYWFWGGTDMKLWEDAVSHGKLDKLPRNHSSKFAPTIEPTMTTGVEAISLAALKFLTLQTGSSL